MPVITCPDCGKDVSTLATACPHCGRPSPSGFAPISGPGPATAAEETLWSGSPSWRVLIGKIGLMVLTLIVAIVASAIAAHFDITGVVVRVVWLVIVIVVLWQGVAFVIALLRLQSTKYTITNQRVMFEQGIFSKSLSEIDLRSVDDTQFFQDFIDRLLGIGNVTLVSSDKALPTTMLHGILDPRSVRELIRARAYQVSQRQVFTRAT